MRIETRYKAVFSRQEVVAALKAAFPDRIAVQAIPTDKSEHYTTPVMNGAADTLELSWTRIGVGD